MSVEAKIITLVQLYKAGQLTWFPDPLAEAILTTLMYEILRLDLLFSDRTKALDYLARH
jgi:hypothetical protein